MVCPRMGGRGVGGRGGGEFTLGNLSSKSSTREGILALTAIPFFSAILTNFLEIIEKSFQKRWNLTLNVMVRKVSSDSYVHVTFGMRSFDCISIVGYHRL